MAKCLSCGLKTSNPKFCSHSCSAKSSNAKRHGAASKALKSTCCVCKILFQPKQGQYRRRRCYSCPPFSSWEKYSGVTVGFYRKKLSVAGKHPSWVNSHIRGFARFWNRALTKHGCKICGYDKHVEVCHIKPVSSFPDSALLGEVNAPENILILCRNCHWEFDRGFIS